MNEQAECSTNLQSSGILIELPFHIWEKIFQYLVYSDFSTRTRFKQFKSLSRLRLANRHFYQLVTESRLGFRWKFGSHQSLKEFQKGMHRFVSCHPNWYIRFLDVYSWDRDSIAMTSEDVKAVTDFVQYYKMKIKAARFYLSWFRVDLSEVRYCFLFW